MPLAIYLPSEIFSNIGFMEEFFGNGGTGESMGKKKKTFQIPLPLQVIHTEINHFPDP